MLEKEFKEQLLRLDQLLVKLKYAKSRERAKALIKAGHFC
jgi:predicted rRNA methylase YqxC with S4 and FtsJ domains